MESSEPTRILVVANRTASTPRLLKEVGRRARAGPATFALLIPDAPNRKAADWTLEAAIPLLEREARGKVEGLVGGPDPFDAVERAIHEGDFDEIIVSTLPKKRSKWLRRDLIRQIERLGLPVTAVVPRQQSLIDALDESDDMKRNIIGGGGGMGGAADNARVAPGRRTHTGRALPVGRQTGAERPLEWDRPVQAKGAARRSARTTDRPVLSRMEASPASVGESGVVRRRWASARGARSGRSRAVRGGSPIRC